MIGNEAHLVKIHHLGLVTGNLDESSELYQKLGYTPESEITHEKNQGVFVQKVRKLIKNDNYPYRN